MGAKGQMDIISAWDGFKNFILFEKRLSNNTYIEYERDLRQFIEFLQDKDVKTIFEINKQIVQDFKEHLKNKRKLTARTIYRKTSALREFFKFLKGRYDFNDFEIAAPKFQTTLPEICSPQLIQKIILFMKTDNNPDRLRNEVMFQLFYTTGIRASELIKIKVSDISFDVRTILINGKGGRQRLVPYPMGIEENLVNYTKTIKDGYLFPFSRQRVWSIIRSIGKKLGIKLYPHKLRNSIATHLMENGAKLTSIKKILGHESINSTCLYTRVGAKLLRKQYDKYHPRARRSKKHE